MRLQKLLAEAGIASRRAAERLMAEGRVSVNGHPATEPGTQADPERDVVAVDGRPVSLPGRHVYIALNKPPGVITTARDPQGRPTALDLVDRPERLFTVGRLDRDTEGLLLLTNDGDWANLVAHPRGNVEKEYVALVDGVPGPGDLRRLDEGVPLPDGHLGHGRATVLEELDGQARVSLILHEGHKRQARLMFGAVGYPVRRLVRVRIGGLRLGDLASGAWRELTPADVRAVTRPAAPEPRGGRRQPARQQEQRHGHGYERREGRPGKAGERRGAASPDDRHRRPGGGRQVDDRPGHSGGPGPAVPGHRHDVPRRGVAGPPARHRPPR